MADRTPRTKRRHRPDGPVRTCVGCRQRDSQANLLRVVVRDGQIAADERRRLHGRGAYVHLEPRCLDRAGRGGLARALRCRATGAGFVELRRAVESLAHSRTVTSHLPRERAR